MKKSISLFLLLLLVWVAPLHLSNVYLRSSDFDIVTIHTNENVWSVAERYTSDTEHTVRLMEAIVEINGLDHEASVYAGQQIKVPVLAKAQYAAK
jgi:hypothetical protein